ncbi:VWA domain-containing protein [Candidatus Uhrbacteria bacterium]|nr:VWA domain-containing protein [Candidatus Uhrbacteria bacterium]
MADTLLDPLVLESLVPWMYLSVGQFVFMPNPERRFIPDQSHPPERKDARQVVREVARARLATQMKTSEGIEGMRAWRALDGNGPSAKRMRRGVDAITARRDAAASDPGAGEEMMADLSEKWNRLSADPSRSRADELMALFESETVHRPLPFSVRPETQRVFDDLQTPIQTDQGSVIPAEVLLSPSVPLGDKAKWMESRLLADLRFLDGRDRAEAREKAEREPTEELLEEKEQSPADNIPPPDQDEFVPSMDEMEPAKEGEVGAFFTVAPFYGGYYREGHYDTWDAQRMMWTRATRAWEEAPQSRIDAESRRTMSGTVRAGSRTSLPVPYGFAADTASVQSLGKGNVRLVADGDGGLAVEAVGDGLASFSLEMGKNTDRSIPTATASFRLDRAREIKQQVRTLLTYSNDSSLNAVYRGGDPAGYFDRIAQHKKADCDVANTYFVHLLSQEGIQARLVTGHYVKTKNHSGAAVLSGGTSHAWAEVFDEGEWHRLDATPPGDPNMDEEETDEQVDGETGEGDYGEQEAETISDEQLEEMIVEAKEALEKKKEEEEKKDSKGKEVEKFAKEAGIAPAEATKILAAIEAARGLKDAQGRNIRKRLMDEFRKIVKDNLVQRLRYETPVRMSQGNDMEDPTTMLIDLTAGEADPTGFARHKEKIEREQVYGGFDVLFLADKSGSMSETDPGSGRPKWEDQQRFIYLFFDAFAEVKNEFRRKRIQLLSPVDVRVGLISFSSGRARIELPIGADWKPKEQATVWKTLQENIGGGTPDDAALREAQSIIQADTAAMKGKKGMKDRLRLVLVSADGGSDDKSRTIQAKESLKALGVVVKAAGIGAGAREIEAAYYPDGTNLSSFENVPDWAAEQVLTAAAKLKPRRVKE